MLNEHSVPARSHTEQSEGPIDTVARNCLSLILNLLITARWAGHLRACQITRHREHLIRGGSPRQTGLNIE